MKLNRSQQHIGVRMLIAVVDKVIEERKTSVIVKESSKLIRLEDLERMSNEQISSLINRK